MQAEGKATTKSMHACVVGNTVGGNNHCDKQSTSVAQKMNIALVRGQRGKGQMCSWIKTTTRKTAITKLCCKKMNNYQEQSKNCEAF